MYEQDRHAIQVTRLTSNGDLDSCLVAMALQQCDCPRELKRRGTWPSKALKSWSWYCSSIQSGESIEYSIVRLTASGALDKSFGTDGVLVNAQFSSRIIRPVRIIVSRTGHIYALSSHTAASAAIHRYTADGKFDSTFGVNGVVDIQGSWAEACDIIELKDNSLVVALKFTGDTNYMLRLAHVSRDGVVDNQFAGTGRHEITLTNKQDVFQLRPHSFGPGCAGQHLRSRYAPHECRSRFLRTEIDQARCLG